MSHSNVIIIEHFISTGKSYYDYRQVLYCIGIAVYTSIALLP